MRDTGFLFILFIFFTLNTRASGLDFNQLIDESSAQQKRLIANLDAPPSEVDNLTVADRTPQSTRKLNSKNDGLKVVLKKQLAQRKKTKKRPASVALAKPRPAQK